MGQDTSIGFGLGYGVDAKDSIIEDNPDCEIPYLIESVVDSADYLVQSINDGYDTEIEETFVYIKEPFKYGNDLTKVKQELLEYLDSVELIPYGEFGVVGGVYIY